MDPITAGHIAGVAFSVASGAWTVGTTLYQFFDDVKHVDQTAKAFASEVTALGTACGAVGRRFQKGLEPPGQQQPQPPADDSAQLWTCLENQLEACDVTISELKTAVSCIEDSGSHRGPKFISQAIRQIKLNMKTGDIAEARNRIQSHTASLQIVLQAVAIEISYLTPQRVDQNLQTQLADLAAKKQDLIDLRAERDAANQQTRPTAIEEDILRASEEIMSSGESLYEASVVGGSILGITVPGKSIYIQDWIRQANALDDIASESSPTETDTPSVFSKSRTAVASASDLKTSTGNAEPNPVHDGNSDHGSLDGYASDLDAMDEFNVEAATAAINEGREYFNTNDFESADTILQEALKMVHELPEKHQNLCDPCELRFMLGMCAFHLHSPSTAEEALLSVVEKTPMARTQNDKRRRQVLDAGHYLAITCLSLGKVKEAHMYCNSSLQGRRRLLGKDDDSSHESVALMAKILELQGNVPRSRILVSMLPQGKREALVQSFSNLNLNRPSKSSVNRPAEQSVHGELKQTSGARNTINKQTISDRDGPDRVVAAKEVQKQQQPRTRAPVSPPTIAIREDRNSVTEVQPVSDAAAARPPALSQNFASPSPTINTVSRANRNRTASGASVSSLSKSKKSTLLLPHVEKAVSTEAVLRTYPKSSNEAGKSQDVPAATRGERYARWKLLEKPEPAGKLGKALLEGRISEALTLAQRPGGAKKRDFWDRAIEALAGSIIHPIHLAALFGDLEIVMALCAQKADVDPIITHGRVSALHCAVIGGSVEVVKTIVSTGCRLDTGSRDFSTPLSTAVACNYLAIVNFLVDRGASMTEPFNHFGSAVHVACALPHTAILHALIRRKTFLDQTVCEINPRLIRGLVNMLTARGNNEHSENPTLADNMSGPDYIRRTNVFSTIIAAPLGVAAYFGHATAVDLLLAHDADVNTECSAPGGINTWRSLNALTLAAFNGSAETVTLLLEKGTRALPSSWMNNGLGESTRFGDPLMHAIMNRHEECAIILMNHGTRVTKNDLNWAKENGLHRVYKRAEELGFPPQMRLYVVDSSGNRTVIDADECDTVDDVKAALQRVAEIPIDVQDLSYNDRRLKGSSRLGEYGIKDLATLDLVMLGPDAFMPIAVELRYGRPYELKVKDDEFELQVKSDDTIRSVKSKILSNYGMSVGRLILRHGPDVLDDKKTLSDYNIRRNDTLDARLSREAVAGD